MIFSDRPAARIRSTAHSYWRREWSSWSRGNRSSRRHAWRTRPSRCRSRADDRLARDRACGTRGRTSRSTPLVGSPSMSEKSRTNRLVSGRATGERNHCPSHNGRRCSAGFPTGNCVDANGEPTPEPATNAAAEPIQAARSITVSEEQAEQSHQVIATPIAVDIRGRGFQTAAAENSSIKARIHGCQLDSAERLPRRFPSLRSRRALGSARRASR